MKARYAAAALLCAVTLACDAPGAHPPRRLASKGAAVGIIDLPAPNSTVGPVFHVAGWAAGSNGVDRVRIYLDDGLVATVPITIARPDIHKEFPQFASSGPLHGFGATVDAGSRAGYCTIRIEAMDKSGAARYVASVNVKIEP
jgi:hypothetical protein